MHGYWLEGGSRVFDYQPLYRWICRARCTRLRRFERRRAVSGTPCVCCSAAAVASCWSIASPDSGGRSVPPSRRWRRSGWARSGTSPAAGFRKSRLRAGDSSRRCCSSDTGRGGIGVRALAARLRRADVLHAAEPSAVCVVPARADHAVFGAAFGRRVRRDVLLRRRAVCRAHVVVHGRTSASCMAPA